MSIWYFPKAEHFWVAATCMYWLGRLKNLENLNVLFLRMVCLIYIFGGWRMILCYFKWLLLISAILLLLLWTCTFICLIPDLWKMKLLAELTFNWFHSWFHIGQNTSKMNDFNKSWIPLHWFLHLDRLLKKNDSGLREKSPEFRIYK